MQQKCRRFHTAEKWLLFLKIKSLNKDVDGRGLVPVITI
jgi:hypothetical protein